MKRRFFYAPRRQKTAPWRALRPQRGGATVRGLTAIDVIIGEISRSLRAIFGIE
jgi:hypothetical protein